MDTKEQKLIEKLESIYQILKKYIIDTSLSDKDWGELKALESEIAALKAEMEKEEQVASPIITFPNKCDVCGNTPSVIIRTNFGSFCEAHVRYFK
jgi:hypothetical protein